VKLREPGDLVAIVPYLLGFEPAESLVTLLVRGGRVRLTARIDLPPPGQVDPLARYLHDLVRQQGPEQVLLLIYSRAGAAARTLGEALAERLAPHGLTEALLVDDQRWWSLTCAQECCPAEGTPYDRSTHPLAAEAVYAGLAVLPDRESFGALVAGPADADLDRLAACAAVELAGLSPDLDARRQAIQHLVEDYLAEPRSLGDAECCRFAALAADVHVRDVAWAAITSSQAGDHVELWRQVIARTVPPLAPGPVCLLGMAAWVSGNGVLLNFCIDKVVELGPGYTMTGLLADIAVRAVPPSCWETMRSELLSAGGRLVG